MNGSFDQGGQLVAAATADDVVELEDGDSEISHGLAVRTTAECGIRRDREVLVVAVQGGGGTRTPGPDPVRQVELGDRVLLTPEAEVEAGHGPNLAAVDLRGLAVSMPDHDLLPVDVTLGALELADDVAHGAAEVVVGAVLAEPAICVDYALDAGVDLEPMVVGQLVLLAADRHRSVASAIDALSSVLLAGLAKLVGPSRLRADTEGSCLGIDAVRIGLADRHGDAVGDLVVLTDEVRADILRAVVTVVAGDTRHALDALPLPAGRLVVRALGVHVALRVGEVFGRIGVVAGGDVALTAQGAVGVGLALQGVLAAVGRHVDGRRPVVHLAGAVRLADRVLDEDAARLLVAPGAALAVTVRLAVEAVVLLDVAALGHQAVVAGAGISIIAVRVGLAEDILALVDRDPEADLRTRGAPNAGAGLATGVVQLVGAGLAEGDAGDVEVLAVQRGFDTVVAEARPDAVRVGVAHQGGEAEAVEALVLVRADAGVARVDGALVAVVALVVGVALVRVGV